MCVEVYCPSFVYTLLIVFIIIIIIVNEKGEEEKKELYNKTSPTIYASLTLNFDQ